jgi:hypothetical protein
VRSICSRSSSCCCFGSILVGRYVENVVCLDDFWYYFDLLLCCTVFGCEVIVLFFSLCVSELLEKSERVWCAVQNKNKQKPIIFGETRGRNNAHFVLEFLCVNQPTTQFYLSR